jgi:predicted ATPase
MLCGALSGRPQLVILDNCDEVVSGCAELVVWLRAQCPELSILVTTQTSLEISGETVWQVSPLTLPDALPDWTTDSVARSEVV